MQVTVTIAVVEAPTRSRTSDIVIEVESDIYTPGRSSEGVIRRVAEEAIVKAVAASDAHERT